MAGTRTDRSTWEEKYGRIRIDAKGRPVYVIREQRDGRRYEVSTGCHTLRAALDEYDRFDKNPAGYMAAKTTGPLCLDNARAEAFLAYSKNEKRNTVS